MALKKGMERWAKTVRDRHISGGQFSADEIANMSDSQFHEVLDHAAGMQRGGPESAMNDIQHFTGGGVYSYAVEHVGDLTHRLAERGGQMGMENVHPKVERTHGLLHQGYGFEREMGENFAPRNWVGTAREGGVPPGEVKSLGTAYATQHMTVPAYTWAMHHAKAAAVSLGLHRFSKTREHLTKLKTLIEGDESYPGKRSPLMSRQAAIEYMSTETAKDLVNRRRQVMGVLSQEIG